MLHVIDLTAGEGRGLMGVKTGRGIQRTALFVFSAQAAGCFKSCGLTHDLFFLSEIVSPLYSLTRFLFLLYVPVLCIELYMLR